MCFKHLFQVKKKFSACSYSPVFKTAAEILLQTLACSRGYHETMGELAFPTHTMEGWSGLRETCSTGMFFLRCSKHTENLLACEDRLGGVI